MAKPLQNLRYQLIRRIGAGEQGAVLLVRDTAREGVKRVLKVVARAASEQVTFEFRRLASLAHENVVRVFDLEVAQPGGFLPEGALFFSAEYVAGRAPTQVLAERNDRVSLVVSMAQQVAAALSHLHARGIVHRDVKPQNLVIDASGAVKLLDLGLASLGEHDAVACGTPAYMSPEALAGGCDARVDLYALGATMFELLTGRPPFVAPDASKLVRAIMEAPLLWPKVADVPPALQGVVTKLLARDPDMRHSSAAALSRDLARVAEAGDLPHTAQASAVLPPPFLAREDALATLAAAFEAVDATSVLVVRVAGAPGVGKTRLVDEAVRRHQLAAAATRATPVVVLGDSWDRLVGQLDVQAPADASAADEQGRLATLVERVAAAIAVHAHRLVVRLCDVDHDPRSAALFSYRRAQPAGHQWLLVVETISDEPTDDGERLLRIERLSDEHVAEVARHMLCKPVAASWTDELARVTGGNSRLVAETVRAAALLAGQRAIEQVRIADVIGSGSLSEIVSRQLAALPARARAIAEAMAVWQEAITPQALTDLVGNPEDQLFDEIERLREASLVRWRKNSIELVSRAHVFAVLENVADEHKHKLHRAALSALGRRAPIHWRARHLAEVGSRQEAVAACMAAAKQACEEGNLRRAFEFFERARPHADAKTAAELASRLAEVALALSRYDDALAAIEGANDRVAKLLRARILQRMGDLDGAEKQLVTLWRADKSATDSACVLARLHVTRGHYKEAGAVVSAVKPPGKNLSAADALCLEAGGLAAMYLGDLMVASRCFVRLQKSAGPDMARSARAEGLLGLLCQRQGAIDDAAQHYRDAHAAARKTGDLHGAAVYAMNRASVQAERGLFGDVLAATEQAIEDFARIGNVSELWWSRFNRGSALLWLGATEAAHRVAAQVCDAASRTEQKPLLLYALMLRGDAFRRQGNTTEAEEVYAEAAKLAGGLHTAEAYVQATRAELFAEMGRDEEAFLAIDRAQQAASDEEQREKTLLSLARLATRTGQRAQDVLAELPVAVDRFHQSQRLDLAWRAGVMLARLHARAQDVALAADALSRARATWDKLLTKIPEEYRDLVRVDPDVRQLAALEVEMAGLSPSTLGLSTQSRENEERLRRLLFLSKRLNSERRLARLLDDVMDAVIEATRAERGFLLLFSDSDELSVQVARNIDQQALAGEELALSRSIAEKAARSDQHVLTVDASFDERFDAAVSVSALKLRSVLAVPLRVKGRVVGTVYVDHRFRRGAFDEDTVQLVLDLADIAAVAIDNARLVEQVSRLNQRLEADLESQQAQLDGARAQLRQSTALELRYPYDALLGRSPSMVSMLRLIDRATDTALPVVISGESGTGKELVARALHQNGPRRKHEFVPINCAAVPETLLEAELFGHARGAFTGAVRDRRGLFEIAHQGTLFLDEIGDTSPAMQTKLLRVLQDGEIRRVGSETAHSVDVRVVCATHHDLSEMVKEGSFREDLFYRLNVIAVDVPPLRERPEDVPVLVAHFLKKLDEEGVKEVDHAAMARLVAYRWPGNVRELENELARAVALGQDLIHVADLSPHVAAADPAAPHISADDLRLKPRVEQLERSLIVEAMAATLSNQTKAAEKLGLSRYGLQKKLKRYELRLPT